MIGLAVSKARHVAQIAVSLLSKDSEAQAPSHEEIRRQTSFLQSAEWQSVSVYVFGNPLYLYVCGRLPAVSVNGWSLEMLLPEQWTQLASELTLKRPTFVFIENSRARIIRDRSREILEFIQSDYQEYQRNESGTWYRLIEPR
jgi:hypothetical protein